MNKIFPLIFKKDLYLDYEDYLFAHNKIDRVPNQLNKHYRYVKQYWELTKKRTAIDIGCRFGEYTHYLVKHFDNVKCFEPRENCLNYQFNRNVPKDKVTVYPYALGENNGTVEMYGGAIFNQTIRDTIKEKNIKRCPVYTLDTFQFDDVDLIKIDVEGYETKVIHGSLATIEKHRPLMIIEQNGSDLLWGWENKENETIELLQSLDYVVVDKIKNDYVLRSNK
jgi:FkbM family methyltransferase